MSTSRHIDKICIAVAIVTFLITVLFMFGSSIGLSEVPQKLKYEQTLFDTSYVHRIDIVTDYWGEFLENAEDEQYYPATIVVDGNKYTNIGFRAKGNTSLSSVKHWNNNRYSFKLEFDHYEKGKSMDGLDKLCLNNLIQDNTMMKDYLVYRMMDDFGADAPLCSYAYLTVNGKDWGLYLAVEAIEDSFLSRVYGSEVGDIYKPDSTGLGGGRGNGKEFSMSQMKFEDGDVPAMPQGTPPMGGSDGMKPPEGMEIPEGQGFLGRPEGAGGPGGGRGSDDVKLKYIDDDPESYSSIFENAKTDVSNPDKARLIASLKTLSSYENIESVVDTEEVLRYFVVHNFVCNGDSYTGQMVHNYYLREKDGQFRMIPWDYNLAYGTFRSNSASDSVNELIDSPVSDGNVDDRPMVGWIFSDEAYTERYHELFNEFLQRWFTNGELEQLIAETAEMIRPYVEKDPTKFCSVKKFENAVPAITQFVTLRGEAVRRQLDGDETAVDVGSLNLSLMGTMDGGMGGPQGLFRNFQKKKEDGTLSVEGRTQAGESINENVPTQGVTPPTATPSDEDTPQGMPFELEDQSETRSEQ